jgi:DNA primase
MAGFDLPRQPGELITALDGDAPGREAAKKLADRATIAGWQVRIIRCPDGSDWNDLAPEVAA